MKTIRHFGPLNLTDETKLLEQLLILVSEQPLEALDAYYSASDGYHIVVKDNTFALNTILKRANFSHLYLSDDTEKNKLNTAHLERLLLTLETLGNLSSPEWIADPIVKALPRPLHVALTQYFHYKYKNMGCLMRGEPFVETAKHQWLQPLYGKTNILANFICASLVNIAANELFSKDIPELKKQSADTMLRGEKLDALEIARRLNSPSVTLPQMTSFSLTNNFNAFFHRKGVTQTKLSGPIRGLYLLNKEQNEYLLPQGTQVSYHKDKDDTLIADIVCSPDDLPSISTTR